MFVFMENLSKFVSKILRNNACFKLDLDLHLGIFIFHQKTLFIITKNSLGDKNIKKNKIKINKKMKKKRKFMNL